MAHDVVQKFVPILVKHISECVYTVADECYSNGLISETLYRQEIVQSTNMTCEDKARKLILAIKMAIETDTRCFDLFISILKEKLPSLIGDKILPEMTNGVLPTNIADSQHDTCKDVVPLGLSSMHVHEPQNLYRDGSIFMKHEESVRLHEQTCTKKNDVEKKLKEKSEEHQKLVVELRNLTEQKPLPTHETMAEHNGRISACENEVRRLKQKLDSLQSSVEEHDMLLKRSRGMIFVKAKELVEHLQHQNGVEIRRKEQMHTEELVKVKNKAQEQMRSKDLEHEVELQHKDLKIKDLEIQLLCNKPSTLKRSNTYNQYPLGKYY